MAPLNFNFQINEQRSSWVRLRTMINLRWFSIVGQLVAITVAQNWLGLQLELGLCYLAVGVSVMGNMMAILIFPENKRLTERENLSMVMFDLLQLAFLLFLTGGLNNPFALLLIGPVAISAAVLSTGSTILLGATAIVLVTFFVQYHLPLRTSQGFILRIPDIFIFGNWMAIVIALVFIAACSRRLASEMNTMANALSATQMALSREQKLTDLGGVVAAAAHELGTPLATIKLASGELMDILKDQPELYDDAALIRGQADRCREILRDMGHAGKSDTHLRQAPLVAVIEEAAEPHLDRGKQIDFIHNGGFATDIEQPLILRKPEIIHGLRNMVQNAVDFAKTHIWIETHWDNRHIAIRIMDDGPGFPPNMLGRIGDPFMRMRKTHQIRPGYEGMGLGLFIAKTLLERTGAELSFANGHHPSSPVEMSDGHIGAIIEITWLRGKIDAPVSNMPLKRNEKIRA